MIVIMKDVSFTYQHFSDPALREINLELQDGSVTALVGAVGAGKTTLLLTLNALIPEFIPGELKGQITVDDVDVNKVESVKMAEHMGLVFDDPVLQIVGLTVEEDTAFGPGNLGLSADQIRGRVAEALARVRLQGFEKRNPRRMSGGEQQCLAIAGILAMYPKLVAMDEPVAMLDPVGKTLVLDSIKELHEQQGQTVLISESGTDIEAVCQFADDVVLMHQGHIVARGPASKVFADQKLIEELDIRAPSVTRLAWALGLKSADGSVPTCLDETYDAVLPLLKEKPVRPVPKAEPAPAQEAPEAPVKPAIAVKNLWHVFPTTPPVEALRGVDLTINQGEMVAILGQNGSGKTTLAYHLVGVHQPTNPDGLVEIDGLNVATASRLEMIQRINYVFQNPANQLFCETFGDEVRYGPQKLKLPPEEIERRVKEALRAVGLEHAEDEDMVGISRAGESLLSVASVLSMEPGILVVDEPTSGLDWSAGNKVMQILTELNRKGRTIIVITHDMELAAKYCRRVLVLKEGQILVDGTPKEVFSQPELLKTASLYPPQITQLAQRLGEYGMPAHVLTVEEFIANLARR